MKEETYEGKLERHAELHMDGKCPPNCLACEGADYSYEDYLDQQADLDHSSKEILPFREAEVENALALPLHGSARASRI